jgi:hypothetical protein
MRPILMIKIGNESDADNLSIDASGTANQMLGAIARMRFELDVLEKKIFIELSKPPKERNKQ